VDHGLDTAAIAVFAGCVIVWGLFSARLERINVTAPIAFVVLGLVVAHEPVAWITADVRSSTARHIAELTLALVLFADASRVNVRELRSDIRPPLRLLGIGLPLTVGLGAGAAAVLFTGVNGWVAVLIGAIVAPTDAALGASILENERVPARIRRVLNVESGLNDGIVTPVVVLCIAGAVASEVAHSEGPGGAVVDLLIGVGMGVGVGIVGAALLEWSRRRGWGSSQFRPLAVVGLAFFAYALTIEAGGNGFVAAFAGGMAFGSVTPGDKAPLLAFTDDTGELLSLLVWFLFGAAMIVPAFEHMIWQDVAFAVLALTVLRMVPVALALAGVGLDRASVAFVGWFGPRGLASVVFALIAVDDLNVADGHRVIAAVALTVLLSVVLHGLTSSPLAAAYGTYAERLHPQGAEHVATSELRSRSIAGDRMRTSAIGRRAQ
jgi:NhaP-type Na+/H+ or K+/H+ antiporter